MLEDLVSLLHHLDQLLDDGEHLFDVEANRAVQVRGYGGAERCTGERDSLRVDEREADPLRAVEPHQARD